MCGADGEADGFVWFYLRQDGNAEGLAGVGGSKVYGQLGEKPPGGLPLHPARELGAFPEARRKLLDLKSKRKEREGERETKR